MKTWFIHRSLAALAALALYAAPVTPASAQTPFEPAAIVNDEIITRFDLDQRVRAQAALTDVEITPAVISGILGSIISDRLRLQAAKAAGVSVSDQDIQEGMDLFARRRGVTLDDLLARSRAAGVGPATYREIVEAELAWREVIRRRYSSRARATDADVQRELSLLDAEISDTGEASAKVLYEIGFLAVATPANASAEEVTEATARLIKARTEIRSCDDVTNHASEFGPGSGVRSGLAREDIPKPLDERVPSLVPGQFTDPVRMVNVVAMAMLCSVDNLDASDQQIEELRRQLVQRNFSRYADAYLQELRRNAVIELR